MDIVQSIVLGVIEGVTEFLPISSTGHMIVVADWLGLKNTDADKAFEVIIQLAAILAVVANYKDKFSFKYFDLWCKVALSFVPVCVVGLAFYEQIKDLFSISVVAIMFILGGIIFLGTEKYIKNTSAKTSQLEDISYKQAFWIGIAQAFAVIPGTSRAGSTIIGGLWLGVSRKVSAEYSFLLALPVMLAASGLDLVKNYQLFWGKALMPLCAGFIVAFLSAYFVMKLFIAFLNRFTFVAFGWYRILFGLLLLFIYS